MHIALAGPIAGDDVRAYVHDNGAGIPRGYIGAPLTGILIGELLRRGHRVTGITTDPTLPQEGGPVRREGSGFSFIACPARPSAWQFNKGRIGRMLDLFAFERRALATVMTEAAPDLVHAHWSYEFALAALDQPSPHLITCHDSPGVVLRFSRSPYRALRYLMARRVFRVGTEFTTVSDYMANELQPAIGYLPQVIPNPVSAHVLALGRHRPNTASRRVAMVCNGWDRRKNPEPALRAFAQWHAVETTAELHLFGAGFGAGEAAQLWAQAEGIQHAMHFHGRLPHRDMVAALSELDALLHPALEESFGVVLAEAMALGLPVVAGRHSGAVPGVLAADAMGETPVGLLTDVQSASPIKQALGTLFDEQYSARSAAALTRARGAYSPSAIGEAYEARYRLIVDHRNGTTASSPSPVAHRELSP